MARSGRERLSRGAWLRRDPQARFVGRRAQLSQFSQNLGRDESEADFLFHVRGLGGVGKSTLLRHWREAARRAGALTAVVDENDVHDVSQAMTALARQIATTNGPLRDFDKAVEAYRREQAVADMPTSQEDGASLPSRAAAQAALGAVALIPGGAAISALANQDALAQGIDRAWAATVGRNRRTPEADMAGLSRAFAADLDRLSQEHRWIVLFFDTWERTSLYLDAWLRNLIQDEYGPFPFNVMVVLAGRDELGEREWAPLRAAVQDIPLEVFTREETRDLLAAHGVTDPDAIDAAFDLSMGLPLLVELIAQARTDSEGDVGSDGDAVDRVVERFVQWIDDPHQKEAVLNCALAGQLNEDVFTAAAPPEARGSWGWLCGQPFVSGSGDFKQYHAVVRGSIVRRQRTHSPQHFKRVHLRLADAQAAWRAGAETELADAQAARRADGNRDLAEAHKWRDERWRRHRMAETYHRLCASPTAGLHDALEQTVSATRQGTAVLRQWAETIHQAARDTTDPDLLSWAERFQKALAGTDPASTCYTELLTHAHLGPTARAWAHAYRGRCHYLADRNDQGIADLNQALALDPASDMALGYRGEAHRLAGRFEEAVTDLTAALDIDPAYDWALAERGVAHRLAGRLEDAVTDLTAALDIDPAYAWALAQRGVSHRQAGRYDEAVRDFTAALDIDPAYDWVLGERGVSHRQAGRYDEAVRDFTAALDIDPTQDWALALRGAAHRQAGRYEAAVTDLTAALDIDPAHDWALGERGAAHRQAGRYDEAVRDFTAALDIDPAYAWALAQRGIAHRRAGRYDEAVRDFTAALDINPAYGWALAQRGEAHRQAGRHDEAVRDFTAVLDKNPTHEWALTQRGVAHRQAGRFSMALDDFENAATMDADDLGLQFEMLFLGTVTAGFAACEEGWGNLFVSLEERSGEMPYAEVQVARFCELFRVLLLEPRTGVAEPTGMFLACNPDLDTLCDALRYMTELSAVGGGLADRADECHRLIARHAVQFGLDG